MMAVFGVLVALAASAAPSLAFAFCPANGAAGSYVGIFAQDAAGRSFAAGFATDRPAWPLQPAAVRHAMASSPRAGVHDMLMQERGRGRGARGGIERGGRGGGAGRARLSPAGRGGGYGWDDTEGKGRGGRGGGAGRARSPAGRGDAYGWDDNDGGAGSRRPDFKRMRQESNREAVGTFHCCFLLHALLVSACECVHVLVYVCTCVCMCAYACMCKHPPLPA